MLSKEDVELFKQAMRGVKPLKKAASLHISSSKKITKVIIRKPEVEPASAENVNLEEYGHETYEANEALFFANSGLQHKVLRQLRQGKISYTKILDLHAHTKNDAKAKLEKFLVSCEKHRVRCVLIIHGKGTATLKSAIFSWLKNYSNTLAIASAVPRDGGAGAMYLLLRK